jgi:site-specific recombinase XerC
MLQMQAPRTIAAPARALSLSELRRLFGACAEDPEALGSRDAALFAVLYGAGLRACEAVALDVADYAQKMSTFWVRGTGRAAQTAYLAPGGSGALQIWLAVRDEHPGPLFWAADGEGGLRPQRLSLREVQEAVRRRAQEAGLGTAAPEDLRCTFLSDLLTAGIEPHMIAALTREPWPQPTPLDAATDRAARSAAIARLRVPYRPHVGETM